MILNSPYISGSLTVTGNTTLIGALTVTGSLAGTATSSSFAYTASSAVSAYTAASAVNATTALTASYATSFTVGGTLTAQTLVVQTITSSVSFITGSTRFGSLLTNTHQFTGSLQITGSGPHYVFGNVGIGTAAPARLLHLTGSGDTYIRVDGNNIQSLFGTDNIGTYIGQQGAFDLRIITNAAERFRITSAGTASFTGNSLATAADAATINLKQNSTTANTGIYLERSGEQKGYYIYMGGSVDSLTFQRNNAGTKADVMSLTRDGNVGIGITAPGSILHVKGTGTYDYIAISNGSTSGGGGILTYQNATASSWFGNSGGWEGGTSNDTGIGSYAGGIRFYTAGGTEKMKITSGGIIYALNGGVDGTYQPMIGGMYTSNNSETNLISTAVSSVAAQSGFRFDVSNGGGSSARTTALTLTRAAANVSVVLSVNASGESSVIDSNPGNTGSRRVLTVQGGVFAASGDSSSKLIIFQSNNGTELGSVQRNGGANVLYNTSSDRRLKEDYQDFNGIDLIKNIKAYDFKWKDTDHRNYGVIADELKEIIPSIVSGIKDEKYEDGRDKYMAVDYGQLTPILIKAIQELKAEIDELKNK